ncbi:hypothetical protein [Corynebacterium sp. HMSC29G08]|uniref:hypothetical protein n=1 Tax=Corynebacterium sp. HMSC29G08 TaxID=1581069 RepID=UPI00114D03E9|nr:hypothetical protein [Corynebacterium sp. HMSC29G08]
MTLPLASKKSVAVAAAAVVLSCTLTACGSDSETTAGGGLSTAATAPGAANATDASVAEGPSAENETSKSSEAKPTTSAGKKDRNGEKKDEGNHGDQAIPTLINPLEDGLEEPTFEPLAGGREGTDAERREMQEVVTKIGNPESFAKWSRVIIENSCAAVREPAMEELERQGVTLDMMEEISAQQEALAKSNGEPLDLPRSEVSVSDVRVEGDRASATVHSKTNAGENESVMLFAKEDGKWKVCTN